MGRMNVRDMWKAKLAGLAVPTTQARAGRSTARALPVGLTLQRAAFVGCVLGVDPSLRGTGLAVIEFVGGRAPVLLRCETVRVASNVPMSEALA